MSTGTSTSIDLTTPFRLDGRVAVVTGASSGLGDRFARVLHGPAPPWSRRRGAPTGSRASPPISASGSSR